MSVLQLPAEIENAQFPNPIKAFYMPGKGYCQGYGTALPTTTVWAKGALFMLIDGAADTNVYVNEAAAGEGTSPTWVAIATP